MPPGISGHVFPQVEGFVRHVTEFLQALCEDEIASRETAALAVAACQAGYSIYFTTLDDLIRKLKAADAVGRFPKQLGSLMRLSLLVIDEVGYLPLDREEANMGHLPARSAWGSLPVDQPPIREGATIVTSNKSFTEWGSVLGDDVLATAILDRLLHHCDVLTINGPSDRLMRSYPQRQITTNGRTRTVSRLGSRSTDSSCSRGERVTGSR
ncbi:ATP-binding protein [Rhodococcus sp. NPDC047139]|uniref:ATP-binding protein n=1 Tax=Rhodococcus sp. NPDC047139 TaxID=3155141 RepID=UPI0033F3AC7E